LEAEAEAEAEAELAEEQPACDGDRGRDMDDGPAAVAEPSSAVVEFAAMVVDDDDDAVAVAVAAAGRVVGADARLGIRLGDCEEK